jgi:hypothetical protein
MRKGNTSSTHTGTPEVAPHSRDPRKPERYSWDSRSPEAGSLGRDYPDWDNPGLGYLDLDSPALRSPGPPDLGQVRTVLPTSQS